ncbi:hypothetical protein EON77_01345, partial [bacterium]
MDRTRMARSRFLRRSCRTSERIPSGPDQRFGGGPMSAIFRNTAIAAFCATTVLAHAAAQAPSASPETRPANSTFKPAVAGQTRAPALKTRAALDVVSVVKGLQLPWSVELLPDGRYLITERPGRLRIASADGKLGEPIEGIPAVAYDGQGGLLDVALDPQFATNKRI